MGDQDSGEGYWDEDVLTLLFFVAADVVLRKGF